MPDKTDGSGGLNSESTKIRISLEDWVEDIAERAGTAAGKCVMAEFLEKRAGTCPQAAKIDRFNLWFWVLVAFLCGLGVLNGVTLAALAKGG